MRCCSLRRLCPFSITMLSAVLLQSVGPASLLVSPGAIPGALHAPLTAAAPALPRSRGARALLPEAASVDLGSLLQLADAGERLTDEAVRAAAGELGWWGSYIKLVEDGIFTLHDFLGDRDIPYPYGLSILAFVLGVKAVTLPLNWQQLSSSSQLKAMKPQQDLVRKWYGDNSDMLNMQTGMLFEKNQVNPLAGCLPSLAQIPVFLGVYYSVTSIAKAKVFSEGFLWLPSLSGPIADRREGMSWLMEGWLDGVPLLGWHDTLCYLTIPAILVVTQTVSLNILGSFEAIEQSEDQTSKSAGLVLRFLPFMLGYFAMNAPAGLGLYWIFNNLLTTAQTFTVKKLTEVDEIDIQVDIAPLGPRRDPVPMPEAARNMEWVPGQNDDSAAADAALEAGAEPA